MAWNHWLTSWLTRLNPGGRLTWADQAAARCEERAWTLVERRIFWLSPGELRGYVRARSRGILDRELRNLPDSLALLGSDASFRAAVADCLVHRLRRRAEMVQSELGYRHAA